MDSTGAIYIEPTTPPYPEHPFQGGTQTSRPSSTETANDCFHSANNNSSPSKPITETQFPVQAQLDVPQSQCHVGIVSLKSRTISVGGKTIHFADPKVNMAKVQVTHVKGPLATKRQAPHPVKAIEGRKKSAKQMREEAKAARDWETGELLSTRDYSVDHTLEETLDLFDDGDGRRRKAKKRKKGGRAQRTSSDESDVDAEDGNDGQCPKKEDWDYKRVLLKIKAEEDITKVRNSQDLSEEDKNQKLAKIEAKLAKDTKFTYSKPIRNKHALLKDCFRLVGKARAYVTGEVETMSKTEGITEADIKGFKSDASDMLGRNLLDRMHEFI